MTAPRQKPVLANSGVVGELLLLLSPVYVLSYAPAMSVMIRRDPTVPFRAGFDSPAFYRPVDWLIDHTPLSGPMFVWADCWGVREDVETMHVARMYVKFGQTIY